MSKIYKRLIWFALTVLGLSLNINAQGYSGGSGTTADPYQIANKADLKYLCEHSGDWDKHFKQTADISFDVGDYSPGGDFYNDGKGFSPIGNQNNRFKGSYDGNGHTITYLYINRPEQNSIGMFGEVLMDDTDEIKNLTLTDVGIIGQSFVGGLIGQMVSGTISSCRVSTGSMVRILGLSKVGGLIGVNYFGRFQHCEVDANVWGNIYAGGLIGSFEGFGGNTSPDIYECRSSGTISGGDHVGGLAGYSKGAIINKSFSSGSVMAKDYVGGFIGSIDEVTISDSYASGDVFRVSGTDSSLGSFIGKMDNSGINSCYSTGSVSGDGWSPTDKGFLGEYVSGTLTGNYWDTQSSGQTSSPGQGAGQIEGKTTAEMKQQATFENWDFADAWGIYPAFNNGYSFLHWQILELSYPLPTDNATNIPLSGELTWLSPSGTDTYDLYFGPQGNMDLVFAGAAVVPSGSYSYHNLAPNSNFEWQVCTHTAKSTVWGPLWSFTTAPAPAAPAYPNPADGADEVQVIGELSWSSSLGAETYDLVFGIPGNMDTIVSGEQAGFSGSYNYSNLAFENSYQWQVIDYKAGNAVPGPTWSFTTTTAPAAPAFPNPPDGATDVPVTGNLSWVFSSGTDTYLLLLGKTGNMDTLVSGAPAQYTGSYSYTSLNYLTAYQWQIIEIKGVDTVAGPVWNFTSAHPNSLVFLSPENGATDIPLIGVSLNWHNSINALSYDLYFGEAGNTVKVASGPAGTFKSFDLDTLLYNTTYHWNVVEIFDSGFAVGTELSFTTVSNCAENPIPEDGAQEVSLFARTLQWDDVYAAAYKLTIRTGSFSGNIVVDQLCFFSEYTHDQNWDFGTTYYCTVEPVIPDILPNPNPCAPLQWQFTTIMPLNEITCWDDLLRLSQNPIFWSLDIQQTSDVDASASVYLDDSDDNGDGNRYNDPNDLTSAGSNDGFSPIGNADTIFTGSYNGNGHKITGLFINRPGGNMAGMFGYVETSGGEIKNLNLQDINITGGTGSTGGLIALLTHGPVSGCSVTGTVNGQDNVGGLIGMAQKISGNIQIIDCRVEAEVTGTGNCVGSIAGWNSGGAMVKCSATGTVIGNISVGGIVGIFYNNLISYSEFNGTVTGQDAVGGLVGSADLNHIYDVLLCHIDAEVISTGIAAGGLAGTIQNGNIICCSTFGTVNGQTYVGGLAGSTLNMGIHTSFSFANLSGISGVGGISGIPSGNISNCYARGNITRASASEINFGGFAGEFHFESINNCYSTGGVSGFGWNPTDKGFLGIYEADSCISNYWDTQTSRQSTSAGQAPGGIEGKTTAEMQQQATFVNWDFENIWSIDPQYNDGYPYLMWQYCINPSDGGTIALSQEINPGTTPDSLTSLTLPTGYMGTLEYKWQLSTESDTTGFTDIAGSDTTGYQPGTPTQTTWFRRLARVDCMPGWSGAAASNIVKIYVHQPPAIAILTPAEGDSLFSYPVQVTGTASDPDNDLDEILVRINGGAWQNATGTENWNIDLPLTFGNWKIEAKAVDAQGLESDIDEVNIFVGVQLIDLYQGWSMISSFLDPQEKEMESVMAEPVNQNLLKVMINEQGQIYWPSQNLNLIGDWTTATAYKLSMNGESSVIIGGEMVGENSVSLEAGVNYMPVLTNVETPVVDAFENPMQDIRVIYENHTNQIYWPDGGIFTLNTLTPGMGYLANMKTPAVVQFPDFDMTPDNVPKPKSTAITQGPWEVIHTGNVHLISVSADALTDFRDSDFLGAFNSEGRCIGFTETGNGSENVLLTVYGDDTHTSAIDGALAGEPLSFRGWSYTDGETQLEANFSEDFPSHDGMFAEDGLSMISGFKTSATGMEENNELADIRVYPNPAREVLYIENLSGFGNLTGLEATLYTVDGRPVKTIEFTGEKTSVNISDMQPGVYMIRFSNDKTIDSRRIIIH
jgi:hypothetical protein